jgi:methionyl-tRNA formyltransferase
MRVVFFGYQEWGHTTLRAILDSSHEVLLVVTHPPSKDEYEQVWPASVAKLAADAGISVLERRYANDQEVEATLAELQPDIIVASDWRTWLSPRIYGTARHGALNVHDGLLPRYGGFAPLNWAVINNETAVGVTVHFMNEEFDLGDIVLQERVGVAASDTATDLYRKTLPLFGSMPLRALELIATDQAVRVPQDPREATFFHKRSARDSLIDWSKGAAHVCALVRAQSPPYPAAFTFHSGQVLEIHDAAVSTRAYGGTAGRVAARAEGGVIVVAGQDAESGKELAVVLKKVRPAGGDVVSASTYFTRIGDQLETHGPCSHIQV